MKRDWLRIYYDILTKCKHGLRVSAVQQECNVGGKDSAKHLERLCKFKLLEHTGQAYVTTEKGYQFLRGIDTLTSMLEEKTIQCGFCGKKLSDGETCIHQVARLA